MMMIGLMVVSCYMGNNYYLTAVWTMPASVLVTSLYNITIEESFSKNLMWKVLITLGEISFEFFLLHQLSIRYLSIVCRKLSLPYVCVYAIAFVISLIGALVMHNALKIRKMKFK